MDRKLLDLLMREKNELQNYFNELQALFDSYDLIATGANIDVFFAFNLARLLKRNFKVENKNVYDNDFKHISSEFANTPNNMIEDLNKISLGLLDDKKLAVKFQNHYYLVKTCIDKINKHLGVFYDDYKKVKTSSQYLNNKWEKCKENTRTVMKDGEKCINTVKAVRNYFHTNQMVSEEKIER